MNPKINERVSEEKSSDNSSQNKVEYPNINYHDIALGMHPSNDMLDNILVLCDGPCSSLLHLLVILKFTVAEPSITFRIEEILGAIAGASTFHAKLVTTARQQIECYFSERENSTVTSEESSCSQSRSNLKENPQGNMKENSMGNIKGISMANSVTDSNTESSLFTDHITSSCTSSLHSIEHSTSSLLSKKERRKRHKKTKRMEKAKRKQAALLSKFKAKQQRFTEKSKLNMKSGSKSGLKSGLKSNKKTAGTKSRKSARTKVSDPRITSKMDSSPDSELKSTEDLPSCVICCQGETKECPLGRIVFLQHNLLPKFSRIPDGVADGHIQVLYQYVFDQKIKININELNQVLEQEKIIRIEDFACESKEKIVRLFKETFKGRASENVLVKAAETLHGRAKDLTHAQDRFLGLSHRNPSPVEQLILLSHRMGNGTRTGTRTGNGTQPVDGLIESNDNDDNPHCQHTHDENATDNLAVPRTPQTTPFTPDTGLGPMSDLNACDNPKDGRITMRSTTRDYYHTAYSLDIDVDRHRTINFEGDGGIQVLSCGHCLHIECYERFLAHQMSQQNAQQIHAHTHLLDLQREFFCPLCRRLGNALLPISLDVPDFDVVQSDELNETQNDLENDSENELQNELQNDTNTVSDLVSDSADSLKSTALRTPRNGSGSGSEPLTGSKGISIPNHSNRVKSNGNRYGLPVRSSNLHTSSSLPTREALENMYHPDTHTTEEMPALIRDSVKQMINNIIRYTPGTQMMLDDDIHRSIEWLRFTLLFNIRLIENTLRYESYSPIPSTTNVSESNEWNDTNESNEDSTVSNLSSKSATDIDSGVPRDCGEHKTSESNASKETDYELVTNHIYKLQQSFLKDNRLETLHLMSKLLIFLSNHNSNSSTNGSNTGTNTNHSNNTVEGNGIRMERIIRGFFATGWVFDTSPLEIATRVLCTNWKFLPSVADKFEELSLTILLTYMGRIIYFLIRWSRATFDEANPQCLEFIRHLPETHFIRFIHDVNVKRFDRHTAHIREHKSYSKYLKSELRRHRARRKQKSQKKQSKSEEESEEKESSNEPSNETPNEFSNEGSDDMNTMNSDEAQKQHKWSTEKVERESRWFVNSIQWFCLPLLRHLAIIKHIVEYNCISLFQFLCQLLLYFSSHLSRNSCWSPSISP